MRDRRPKGELAALPGWIEAFTNEQGLWHETEEDRARAVAEAKERARLLRWVRGQMARRLTRAERRAIELYYFQGLTYREAAARIGVNPTTVYRGVRRSIRKLRAAAKEEGPRLRIPRGGVIARTRGRSL